MLNEPTANLAETSPELVSGPLKRSFSQGRKSDNIVKSMRCQVKNKGTEK